MPKSRAHAMAKSRERRVVAALGRIIETDAKQKFKMPHRPGLVRAWKTHENTTNVWNKIYVNVMMNLYDICNDCASPFGNELSATKRQQSGLQHRECIIRRISKMIKLLRNLMIYPYLSK